MNLKEEILRCEEVVKVIIDGINDGQLNGLNMEEIIVTHINRIGQIMLDEVVESIPEPVTENRVIVDGEVAVFGEERNLRFFNRFGGQTVRLRRCYKFQNKPGGWYPLDEKLGLNYQGRFSPLMTYLQALFGASEPYSRGEELLSKSIGFSVSATAIQRNTEMTGDRIDGIPYQMIPVRKREETCELMVVEIDGTMSPQIREKEGILGRKSLCEPTEYKECNLITVEKWKAGESCDRWVGACYGPRKEFDTYVRRTGIQMGQMKAASVVFVADGAKSNWEIQRTNFPDAVPILDFYHATEHLSAFCDLFKKPEVSRSRYARWRNMLLEGEVLQVISEMKNAISTISGRNAGWGEINYFENNRDRMNYKLYRDRDFPIGSGVVEGSCKSVVGKRFKGSGMRWKKADNKKVLKVRLAKVNGTLTGYFIPKMKKWSLVA